ncbi:Gfo/Idh/MocA family oxidoreductase [Bradyrhizobium sp. S69]|uniref:Gfo/Idh/MocA family protein n=1 Tax=Bradyrhizobium sp. S69 TaxID=1641856 RepID=UPI00131EA056|nr:Gfo/Idh/MocA family oxidoreductase [Bradyrhizobium sp. S69]
MSGQAGVAIVGCGLIGQKRAKARGDARLVVCADIAQDRADRLAATAPGCKAVADWKVAVSDPSVSVVIISTLHDTLAEIAHGAVAAGKHALIEKPAARRASELEGLAEAAAASGSLVRVGFNHRYHRALQKAHQLVTSGALGPLMFLRARYGHGGRLGYDREWRSDPVKSGGGELIDQGPHLIDLARWFLGDFPEVEGFATTYFWDMPVDDNGFLLLKTASRQVAFLHASCTEWKNTFSFEIYGRDGKIEINGLGGSYGTERLTYYKMLPEMGPPETTTWEYPMADNSWDMEFAEFLEDIRLTRQPSAGLHDAIEALKIIEKIYGMSGYDHHA